MVDQRNEEKVRSSRDAGQNTDSMGEGREKGERRSLDLGVAVWDWRAHKAAYHLSSLLHRHLSRRISAIYYSPPG